jgi:hypothetical protein
MLKQHFEMKKGFDQIHGKYNFYIQIQENDKNTHLFTVKISENGNLYTKLRVQGPISVEAYNFIRYFDFDIQDRIPIPESEKFYMNKCKKCRFTPVQSMTFDFIQLTKFMQQLYEIKYRQFQIKNQKTNTEKVKVQDQFNSSNNNTCIIDP